VRRHRAATALGTALALSLCVAWSRSVAATRPATPSSPALRDLTSVAQLQAAFEADQDKTRVVLLLSPT